MGRFIILGCLTLLCAGLMQYSATFSQGNDNKVTLQVVPYSGLANEVLKHRGKVVVVDVWYTT